MNTKARTLGSWLPRTASAPENEDTGYMNTNSSCTKPSMTVSISLRGRKITSATQSMMIVLKKLGLGTSRGEGDGCTRGGANSFISKLTQYGGGNHHYGNFKVGAFENSGRGEH